MAHYASLPFFLLLSLTLAYVSHSYLLLPYVLWVLFFLHVLQLWLLYWSRKKRALWRWLYFFSLLPALLYLDVTEIRYAGKKRAVLGAPDNTLQALGQHFIVGYSADLDELLVRRAVGGFYLSRTLVQQLSLPELQALTGKMRAQGLFVTADQEGGVVNHLSPPLPAFAHLKSVLHPTECEVGLEALQQLARKQAGLLKEAGVNWNFAPVVDLPPVENSYLDFYTSLDERSIASDPELVRQVMLIYCAELARVKIACTRKHFPGLGGVQADTHVFAAALPVQPEILSLRDWLPFEGTDPIMLAHVHLQTDPFPASSSPTVVALLREGPGAARILITDDFSMDSAVATNRTESALRALRAGVDFILVSHHQRRYFEIMYGLLEDVEAGRLDLKELDSSGGRISVLRTRLF